MKGTGVLIAGILLAQPLAAQLPPLNPPFHGGPPPLGGGAPNGANPPNPLGPQAQRPADRTPRQNRPRGARISAIDYFDYAETTPMWTIDSPVTGFGNEALWEELDPNFAPVAKVARVSTGRVASR